MREYTAGQTYLFEVTHIAEFNERKYIYLSDGVKDTYRVTPYDFQLEWEPYNLPKVLNCYVNSVNEIGLPILTQVRSEVLAHNYTEEGTEYAFKLVAKRADPNTSKLYYELHDAFGLTHRYYPKLEEVEREVSDIFSLVFKGINDRKNNKAYLELAPAEITAVHTLSVPKDSDEEGLYLGSEGESLEFKSTIIYPAGSIEPNIDQQMMIICKTIAGFMNKSGGVLYVGVNDTGRVSGISQDFEYLNSSKIDGKVESHKYSQTNDGYELKIRDSVKYLLGNTANANIQISFLTHENHSYCKVVINEVLKPIFLNQTKIYQRAGNMTQLLKGDEIAWLIEERYRKRIWQEGAQIQVSKPESIDEVVDEVIDEAVKPEVLAATDKDLLFPIVKTDSQDERIWYWMSFYQDGSWSFDKKASKAADKIYEVPIPTSLKKERLMMAYNNGCVNVVIPYDQINPEGRNGRKLRKTGHRYSNGWNTASEIMSMFCVDRKDLLVFKSQKTDGAEWVKIHNVSAISVHGTLHLEGNVLINSKLEATLTSIQPLALHNFHFISSLVLKDHQRSASLGFRRKDKSLDKVYHVLDQLIPSSAQSSD
jgi:hypothetical protein